MTLGEKIKEARKQCMLSQEELAEKMSVSRSAIAKWETDKGLPDIDNLKMIAKTLNVSLDYLLDDSDESERMVVRESYDLSQYGKGSKKKRKDRVVKEKLPFGSFSFYYMLCCYIYLLFLNILFDKRY
ncbi:MAG: helix-turn-helix transcriptional regulator [Eubacteriales bacterium]|nr:helix-turn-helix transcriptional regulator [Eubacteriales bacterium]